VAKPVTPQLCAGYEDLSPVDRPLDKAIMERLNAKPEGWFGADALGGGYVQVLLERFASRNADAAAELAYIANEAKWSSGWKDFGRQILEVLSR